MHTCTWPQTDIQANSKQNFIYLDENIDYTTSSTTINLQLFWNLSRTTWVSWYKKGKTNVDLLEQEIVSGSDICWAICKSDLTPDR